MKKAGKFFVTSDGKTVFVDMRQPLGDGGQGSVFAVMPNPKAKRMRPLAVKLIDDLTPVQEAKLMRLIELRNAGLLPHIQDVCFPRDAIYNRHSDGRLVCRGYVMDRYLWRKLSSTVFKPLIVRDRMGWSRIDICTLACELLGRIHKLHEAGFLVGDIKPENILVGNDPRQVAIVDTDSFQFETFACPVHTPEFTPPRLLATKDFSSVMRTPEDERYAVAVLLFKMMLIGKNPYARSDGKTLEEYIAERDFVFPLGYEEAELMPKGPWQLIWFNMPQSLRKAFYDAFRNDIYPKTEEWIPLIEEYITLLSAGRYPADIFPSEAQGLGRENVFQTLNDRDVDPVTEAELLDSANVLNEVAFDPEAPMFFLRFHTRHVSFYEIRPQDILQGSGLDAFTPKNIHLGQHEYIADGCFDIQRFVNEKADDLESLRQQLAQLRTECPSTRYLYAFGGTLLRNLSNRSEVIAMLQEQLGIHVGLNTLQEEREMTMEMCLHCFPNLVGADIAFVKASGLSAQLVTRKADGTLHHHRFERLGYHTLRERLFATAQSGLATEELLRRHDYFVQLEIDRELPTEMLVGLDTPALVAGGTVNEWSSYIQNAADYLSVQTLREGLDKLTSFIISNRQRADSIAETISANRYLFRMLNQRLAMPIYIALAEKLNQQKLLILRHGTAQAFILHTIRQSVQ